jgi:Lar family restriction alleviation protein
MDIMKIVKDGLIANGCDGLFVEDGCACKLDDLAPCGEFNEHCCPGVLIDIESCPNCTPSAPCDFHMGHNVTAHRTPVTDQSTTENAPGQPVDSSTLLALALPCPFCGQRGVSIVEGSTFRWRKAVCDYCDASCGEIRIQTIDQTAETLLRDEKEVIEEWNKRANARHEPSRGGGAETR